jgi:YD repeat-containing protein
MERTPLHTDYQSLLQSISQRYEYNEDGSLIAVYQIVGSDRRLIFTNKFNDKNQIIKKYYPKKIDKIAKGELVTNETGKRIEYDYDSEGNLSVERTFENGKLVNKQKYFYKKFGH